MVGAKQRSILNVKSDDNRYGVTILIFYRKYNQCLKNNTQLTNEGKIELLDTFTKRELLDLLRNIEDSPRDYERAVIQKVYDCLYVKGIMCL